VPQSTGHEDPDDRMTAWPTGRLLSTAARMVEHAWIEALDRAGITHAGLIVLHLLEAGPLSQAELASRARVETQTMSRTVERLERDGFVSRSRDGADRRRFAVTITAAGRDVWKRTRMLEAEVFPTLGDPDALRDQLLEIIRSSTQARWR
jgi:DNA-binding MarR family transcriptional regulator